MSLAELTALVTGMQATISTQAETIVALKGKMAETKLDEKVELPAIPKEPVKRDGKEYAWQVAIMTLPIHGKVTAAEAALSEEIITLILSTKGQGILKELV